VTSPTQEVIIQQHKVMPTYPCTPSFILPVNFMKIIPDRNSRGEMTEGNKF